MMRRFDAQGAVSGIYAIYIQDKLVYIGKSTNLNNRVYQHERGIITGKGGCSWYNIAKEFYIRDYDIKIVVVEPVEEKELLAKEQYYIELHRPIFNTRLTSTCNQKTPKSFGEAISMLRLPMREVAKQEDIANKERAEQKGWFGESYINKNEFFWWEYEQVYGNYKRPSGR